MQIKLDITTLIGQTAIKVKNDLGGQETIADLRRQARIENAKSRAKALLDPSYNPVFVRVVTFGRLGKNSPHADIYRQRNKGSFHNAYQRIATQHAAELAVYINPMSLNTWHGSSVYSQTSIFKFVK
jgi:hypothetical protein